MSSTNNLSALGALINKQGTDKKSINKEPVSNKKSTVIVASNELELTADAQVSCYQAIATLTITQSRPDLQSIISTNKNSVLPPRLQKYLQITGVFDNDMALTDAGNQLKNSGKISLTEKGLYNLWYCEHGLLGTRLIAIQRIDATQETIKAKVLAKEDELKIQPFHVNSEITVHCLNIENKSWTKELVSKAKIEIIANPELMNSATIIWDVESNNQVKLQATLKAKISNGRHGNKDTSTIENKVSLAIPIADNHALDAWNSLALAVEGKWEVQRKSIAMPLTEAIDSYESLNSCTLKHKPIDNLHIAKIGAFNIVRFNPINIEPSDQKEGVLWLKAWLKHYFNKAPVTPLQAEKDQLAWRSKQQIAHHDIAPIGQYEVIKVLEQSGRNTAYWNAVSTMDLVPTQPKSIGLPLTLNDGEIISPNQLLNILSDELSIENMIVSDRYYRTDNQRKLLYALNESITGNSHLLVTANAQDIQTMPQGWKINTFERNMPENHDRYWLLKTSIGFKAWKVSTSLDFLREQTGEHSWQVVGHPTFTPLTINDLPTYLKNMLEVRA